MPEGSPFPRALTDAYGGAPPWRKLAAWGAVFTLGLVLVAYAASAPGDGWAMGATLALGLVLMAASVALVAFDVGRTRDHDA